MPRAHRVVRTATAAVAATLLLGGPGTAHAEDSYRFWAYFHLEGHSWEFAPEEAARTVPADGSVDGYRFAVGEATPPRLPRALQTFEEICAATPAAPGRKRVGVVVDFGRRADARDPRARVPRPWSKCAVVDRKATGEQVLAAVARTRAEATMVCGIDGYPASGCSDVVPTLTAEQKAPDDAVALPDASAPRMTRGHVQAQVQEEVPEHEPTDVGAQPGRDLPRYLVVAAGVLGAAAGVSALPLRRPRRRRRHRGRHSSRHRR